MKAPYLIALIALILSGCARENRNDCLTSTGSEHIEVRILPPFTSILAEDRVNITVRRDSAFSTEVIHGENLLQHVHTEVTNGELRISYGARCNWVRDLSRQPTVVISAPTLARFENRGTGNIDFTDSLRASHFIYEEFSANGKVNIVLNTESAEFLQHTGSTELRISGQTESVSLYSAGHGQIDAAALDARYANVNNSTFQDIRVRTTEYLYAFIGERGNVCYFGEPELIDREITGSGRVLPCE